MPSRPLAEIVDEYTRVIAAEPFRIDPYLKLGAALRGGGVAAAAVDVYRSALKLLPEVAELWANLGNALLDLGQPREALAAHDRALALTPGMPELHANRATALLALDRFADAESCLRRALVLAPESPGVRRNLGVALKEQGRLGEAASVLREAIQQRPDDADAHWNLALVLLMDGPGDRPPPAEAEGWREYEWRRRIADFQIRDLAMPVWDGTPLAGRSLLLQAEQGLGDTLQFVRFAVEAKRRGAGRVAIECPAVLREVLGGCPALDEIAVRGEPSPRGDVRAPLLSMPHLCGGVPSNGPYLVADGARIARWAERVPRGRLNVGIAWQGSRSYRADARRSIPLAALEPLADVAGVCLYRLQKGEAEDASGATARLVDPGPGFDAEAPFVDTAALLTSLDLVVTSDSAVAHLAGALGREVWLLLCHLPDWRWGTSGERTRWYPTMRIFRQPRPGDWRSVVSRVAGELGERAARTVGRRS